MKLKKLENYSGSRAALVICYWVVLSPIIVSIFALISYIFCKSPGYFGSLITHAYIYAALIPVLFLAIDLYKIITKQVRFDCNFKETIKTSPELFILFAFMIWNVIATILQLLFFNKSLATKTLLLPYAVHESILLFIIYASIVLMAYWVKDRKLIKNILFTLTITIIFILLFSLIDPTGKIPFQKFYGTNWASMFVNSNHYGYILSIITPFFAMGCILSKERWKQCFCLVLMIISISIMMFNDTFGSLLAVFSTFILIPIFYPLFKNKFEWKTLIPIVSFIIISFIAIPIAKVYHSTYKSFFGQLFKLFQEMFIVANEPTSEAASHAGTDRWGLWLKAIQEIIYSPLIGTGNTLLRPHNEYLQFAVVWGLPSLILYLSAFVVIAFKAIKHRNKISNFTLVLLFSIISYLISAIFGNTMPHTSPLFGIFLGFFIRLSNEDYKSELLEQASLENNIQLK